MRTRTRALVGSLVFFWVAPAVVAGVGPFALVGWTMQPPLLGLPGERVVGVAAVAAGLACLLDCFARFALEGRGTPAPVAQTEVLVASGLYRFVRNPMYVSLLIIVSGPGAALWPGTGCSRTQGSRCWSRSTCSCSSMRSRHSVEDSKGRTRPIAYTWVDGGHV